MTVSLYRHRINTVAELESVPTHYGIEFDLRSDGDDVIVTHDPYTDGPPIEAFFPHIGRRPCIFNVKCEGIEPRVLALASQYGIDDFFFLDCSVPAAVKLWRAGERRIAVRWSEYEPVEGVLAWADKASWCWVDCFHNYPGNDAEWARVAAAFRICLVSPELQGHGVEAIARFRDGLGGRSYHAVCSKRPELWSEGM
ncbi:MAG TPA: hypothetical protein VI299_25500 [Polyangiales bacterium]